MERCSGYRPSTERDAQGIGHAINGTCAHGFFVTPPCYSKSAAEKRAPVCCNEDWAERLAGSFLDERGMPKLNRK